MNLATDDVVLPPPTLSPQITLDQALKDRHSTRTFFPDTLSLDTLSALLWTGFGINRPEQDGRTASSAHNWQEIDIYVLLAEGAYRYDARAHRLLLVKAEDLRRHTGTHDFVATAPLDLVYVADFARMPNAQDEERKFLADADAGCIAQNIYLYCAGDGLGTDRGIPGTASLTTERNTPMKQPLQIQFLGMEPSQAVESAVREKAGRLDRVCTDIMSCRVSIEQMHKHQHQGRPFAVRIDVTVPGRELTVGRVQDEDVYVALRDAFDAIKRQIEDAVRRNRGQEKLHPPPLHGEVVRIDDKERCGFIQTPDGDEYWFGHDHVADVPFEHVEVGAQVQFIPELAAQGRQAKRVSLGKHRFG